MEECSNQLHKLLSDSINSKNNLDNLTNFFQIMSSNTRIKILILLTEAVELCVSDISCVLNMTTSAVSHQLKILKKDRLIKSNKKGKNIYYSLDDNHIKNIIEAALEHTMETL